MPPSQPSGPFCGPRSPDAVAAVVGTRSPRLEQRLDRLPGLSREVLERVVAFLHLLLPDAIGDEQRGDLLEGAF
jgi:hypothetical protein